MMHSTTAIHTTESVAATDRCTVESATGAGSDGCVCRVYQQAVELVGRRWNGAIITVLLEGPRRFSEIAIAVPDLSDRLLSQRLKELEDCGMVERVPCSERASSVRYSLLPMGRELAPALEALESWANRWLADRTA
jgi:DNA-binding HxlR family transcriptional regulator